MFQLAETSSLKLHYELSDLKEEKKRQKLEDGMKILVFENDGEVTGMCYSCCND